MLQTEFKSQVDNLMNILFGAGVASHATIIEQINYLVFLRSLSKKDDSAIVLDPSAERIFSGQLSKFHWDNLLLLNADALFNTLEEIFRQLPELATDKTIKLLFRDAHVKVFDKPTLRRLLHEIEKMMAGLEKAAASGHTDIFGDMYEYLLGKLSQAGTLGSFRTPRHIIKFMVDIVDPVKGETILDPACGTAGFLVAALEHIKDKYTSEEFKKDGRYPMDLLKPGERDFVYKNTFTGFDSDFDMFKFGLMNLFLHKLEHPNIKRQNTLVDTAGDRTKWDVILANPPFAGALDVDSISEDIRMGTRATEILFLRYMIDHLSPNGRAGVIVPEGVMFNSTNAHKKIRQILVEDAGLWCVVSLPNGIFNPYAGVKTSILFFDKSLKNTITEILFLKVDNDGFDPGATKRKIDKNDLPEALEVVNKWKNAIKKESRLSSYVKKTAISNATDYSLSPERYQATADYSNIKWPMIELSEVCDLLNGYAFKSSDYIKLSNTLNFRMSNIRPDGRSDINYNPRYLPDNYVNKFKNFVLQDGDVVIAMTDMASDPKILGVPTIVKKDNRNLLLNQRVGKFIDIDRDRIYIPYLKHVLTTQDVRDYYKTLGSGGLQVNIAKKDILRIKIPLPPINIQKQIVEELNNYQNIIDGAEQVLENWKPTIEVNPIWKKVKLGDLVDVKGGKRIPKGLTFSTNKTNYPYIRVVDFKNNTVETKNLKYIDESIFKQISKYTISKDDVYISIAGTIGLVGVVPIVLDNKSLTENAAKLVLKDREIIDKDYLVLALSTSTSKEQIKNFTKGVGVPKLALDRIKSISIPLPPIIEQKKIVEEIEKEKAVIAPLQELIKVYKEKINQKIQEVWGSENIKT